ncbi:Hypothetical predicted protein, partial [Lynx pardinus]
EPNISTCSSPIPGVLCLLCEPRTKRHDGTAHKDYAERILYSPRNYRPIPSTLRVSDTQAPFWPPKQEKCQNHKE